MTQHRFEKVELCVQKWICSWLIVGGEWSVVLKPMISVYVHKYSFFGRPQSSKDLCVWLTLHAHENQCKINIHFMHTVIVPPEYSYRNLNFVVFLK